MIIIVGRLLLPVHAVLYRLVCGGPRHDPPRQQPDRQVGQGEGHCQRGALCRLLGSRCLPPDHKVRLVINLIDLMEVKSFLSGLRRITKTFLITWGRRRSGSWRPSPATPPSATTHWSPLGTTDMASVQPTEGMEVMKGKMTFWAMLMLRKSMDTWGKDTALKLQRRPSKVQPKSSKARHRSTPPPQQETSLSNKTIVRNASSK